MNETNGPSNNEPKTLEPDVVFNHFWRYFEAAWNDLAQDDQIVPFEGVLKFATAVAGHYIDFVMRSNAVKSVTVPQYQIVHNIMNFTAIRIARGYHANGEPNTDTNSGEDVRSD